MTLPAAAIALALVMVAAGASASRPADPCAPVLAAAQAGQDPATPVRASGPVVRAPLSQMILGLAARFGDSRPLAKALSDLGGDNDTVSLYRLGRTDVYAAESVQGTAHCASDVFFRASPGRPPAVIDGPLGRGAPGLCWDDVGRFASIAGHPVFVETSSGAGPFRRRIGVTPWTGGGWSQACYVRATYAYAPPRVAERFTAPGLDDDRLDRLALAIAVKREQAPGATSFSFGPLDALQDPAFARMRALAQAKAFPTGLPSFGAEVKEPYASFAAGDAVLFPVDIDGKTYLGRLGGGWIGWRSSNVLLLALYRLQGQLLAPAAGFVIDQSRGALRSVERVGRGSAEISPAPIRPPSPARRPAPGPVRPA